MPMQRLRQLADRLAAPEHLLVRAIRDIDRRLERSRLDNHPAPLDVYRARRILEKALARCREHARIPPSAR